MGFVWQVIGSDRLMTLITLPWICSVSTQKTRECTHVKLAMLSVKPSPPAQSRYMVGLPPLLLCYLLINVLDELHISISRTAVAAGVNVLKDHTFVVTKEITSAICDFKEIYFSKNWYSVYFHGNCQNF